MTRLRLYSRPDCHLCALAQDLVEASGVPVEIQQVDTEGDVKLLTRYGVSIPVIQEVENGQELFWPFDAAELAEFLSA
jgi:glutaredoxin